MVSHPLPQHPQVVDDDSTKKVSGILKCHLQLVHLSSWHREGVSTSSQGKEAAHHFPPARPSLDTTNVLHDPAHSESLGSSHTEQGTISSFYR